MGQNLAVWSANLRVVMMVELRDKQLAVASDFLKAASMVGALVALRAV